MVETTWAGRGHSSRCWRSPCLVGRSMETFCLGTIESRMIASHRATQRPKPSTWLDSSPSSLVELVQQADIWVRTGGTKWGGNLACGLEEQSMRLSVGPELRNRSMGSNQDDQEMILVTGLSTAVFRFG